MLPLPTKPLEDDTRVMTPEEVAAQRPIFEAANANIPDPATSVFIGAFRGGKCVAFLVLQIKLHAEPMYIEEGHAAVMAPLVHAAERYILEKVGPQWVYLFAPAGRVSQMAQSMGMQLEPWVVLSKLVTPPVPDKGVTEFNPIDWPVTDESAVQ